MCILFYGFAKMALSVLVKKIFTKNRSDIHYFLTDFSNQQENFDRLAFTSPEKTIN